MGRSLQGRIEEFLEDLRGRGYAVRSRESYASSLRMFTRYLEKQGIDRLEEIIAPVLVGYHLDLQLHGREGRPLSTASVSYALTVIRMFFQYLVKRQLILVNPAEALPTPKVVRSTVRRTLRLEQMKSLLLSPDLTTPMGLRDRAILEILYATGIRVTELIGLDVGDVDLVEKEVWVRRGKGRKSRCVPLGESAGVWVARYLGEARPQLVVQSSERALILSYRGKRMDRANLSILVRTHGKRAGIDLIVTPHVLRHTFATHLIKAQASIRHIQEMLGHVSLATTQVYTHVEISDLKETHRRCHPRGQRKKPADDPGKDR